MAALTGKTRLSSRGQVVIPKALRDAAGIAEGDELEVIYDGERLFLAPCPKEGGHEEGPRASEVRKAGPDYVASGREAGKAALPPWPTPTPGLSKIWADRIRAVEDIKRLREQFGGIDWEELRLESRRELEERLNRGRS